VEVGTTGTTIRPAAEDAGNEVLSLAEAERRAVIKALTRVDGNRRRAAELLGIGERTLYEKIKRYGLDL
jgi:DNA-binding NtrC family response regulator